MTEIIKRIMGSRTKFGTRKRILLRRMKVKNAFRNEGVSRGALRVSPGEPHIRRPPFIVRVVWKPRVVRGGSERNSGSSLCNDVDIIGYIGGSRRSNEPRRRYGIDGEGRGAITTGVSGTKGARRRIENPTWVGILCMKPFHRKFSRGFTGNHAF